MKTRIFQTRFWDDPVVLQSSKDATLLWVYLISNKELGMTNYVHIPDQFLQIYCKFNPDELEAAKVELEATKKMYFFKGWIFYPKLEDENKYANSPKNAPTYDKELQKIPNDVKAYFAGVYTSMDSTIDTSRHSNHKSKIKNQKSKSRGYGGEKKVERKKSLEFVKTDNFLSELLKAEWMKKYYLSPEEYDYHLEKMLDYYENKGKQIKSYPAAIRNWLKQAAQFGELRVNEFNSITSIV